MARFRADLLGHPSSGFRVVLFINDDAVSVLPIRDTPFDWGNGDTEGSRALAHAMLIELTGASSAIQARQISSAVLANAPTGGTEWSIETIRSALLRGYESESERASL